MDFDEKHFDERQEILEDAHAYKNNNNLGNRNGTSKAN